MLENDEREAPIRIGLLYYQVLWEQLPGLHVKSITASKSEPRWRGAKPQNGAVRNVRLRECCLVWLAGHAVAPLLRMRIVA